MSRRNTGVRKKKLLGYFMASEKEIKETSEKAVRDREHDKNNSTLGWLIETVGGYGNNRPKDSRPDLQSIYDNVKRGK